MSTFSTHLTGGLLAGVLVASALRSDNGTTAIGVVVAAVAALVPDRVNIYIPLLRVPLFEGHRSVFNHSLITALVAYLIVREQYSAFAAAGIVSHLLLDLPSDAGLPLFWPLYRRRVALGWWRNGGRAEAVTRAVLVSGCVMVVAMWI